MKGLKRKSLMLRVLQVNLQHSRAASAACFAAVKNCDVDFMHEP
jgi:hypothetical protein